ncbi:MAG: hypothetical protein HYS20_12275 [Rhodocyclales bacterium]|nr:hypothetical protein [Rhodocyclales bacterium]
MPIRVALIEDNPEFLRHFADIVEAAGDPVLAGRAASAAEGPCCLGFPRKIQPAPTIGNAGD